MNNESDFMQLTTFSMEVFTTQIIGPIKAMLSYEWIGPSNSYLLPQSGNIIFRLK